MRDKRTLDIKNFITTASKICLFGIDLVRRRGSGNALNILNNNENKKLSYE